MSRPYRTGFCNPSNPPDSHARCNGSTQNQGETLTCSCTCHIASAEAGNEPELVDTIVSGPRLGVYEDLNELAYHADPTSVSASGMKTLLKRSPKQFRYEQTHPKKTKAMDVGTAAHKMVLGVGADIITVPADLLAKNGAASTTAAKEFIAAAEAAGLVVLSAREYAAAERMADAVLTDPQAGPLFTSPGRSELSMFWRDPEFELIRRCRWDRLGDDGIGVDLKKTRDAHPDAIRKTITTEWGYGYDLSAAWYLQVAAGIGVDIAAYALVFVDDVEPHDVVVVELSDEFWDRGAALTRKALSLYRRCLDTGTWPGYTTGPITLAPPDRKGIPTAEQILLTIPEGTAAA